MLRIPIIPKRRVCKKKGRKTMKNILKISIATSLIASLALADTNEELTKKVQELQKQLKELKASQEDGLDELDERIDEVETSTLTDKINFGLEFRSRVDNFKDEKANGESFSQNNVWSNRLRLDMRAKVTEGMKFVGRLTMYKNWSDSGDAYTYSSMDPMQGRRPSDSGIFVERAYVDWKVYDAKVPLVLTIGRQPSSDGPSHQFKDNTVRKSTYSALSFDGAADGVVATLPLNKLTGIDGMAVRIGYGKGFQKDTTVTYVGNPDAIKDSNVYGVFFDTSLGLDGSLLQLSAVGANHVVSNVPNDNKNIGKIALYTAMLEFTNIVDSGLDFFAHYAMSQSKPNGEYSLMDTSNAPSMTNPPLGLLTSTPGDTDTKNGHAFWVGARYKLPISAMKEPKIGAEFNKGNKYWFSFTQGSNDFTNKLATRGSATEVYYIQPINRYAFLRLGAQWIDYDYTGSGYQIGAPMSMADAKTMNPNALNKLTNYYLLFNLTY